jgi:hypothetical protein
MADAEAVAVRTRTNHEPLREATCRRCDALIVIGEQVGGAELRYIAAHLRGCAPKVFRADSKPNGTQLFKYVRVESL